MEARNNIHNKHIIMQKYVGVKVTEVMRYIALVYSLGPPFSSLYISLAVSHTCRLDVMTVNASRHKA